MKKNLPPKIYLAIGFEVVDEVDFKRLQDVAWCSERLDSSDPEYTLNAPTYEQIESAVNRTAGMIPKSFEAYGVEEDAGAVTYEHFSNAYHIALMQVHQAIRALYGNKEGE